MVAILAESLYGTTMARGPGQQPEKARGGDCRRADHRPAGYQPHAEPRRRTWAIGHHAQEPASVLLRWSQQGTFVLLSVLGSSDVNQRLVVTLADHLRLVTPDAA
jgi:hypothetical protein